MTPRTAPALSVQMIQSAVCSHYRIPLREMSSARRWKPSARARQIAMYLARELTPYSLPQIGRCFGGRDHTTVMHAIQRIQTLRADDRDMDRDIKVLQLGLEARG